MKTKQWAVWVALGVAIAACSEADGGRAPVDAARTADAIRDGTPVLFPNADAYVYIRTPGAGFNVGTGILLSPEWVLTAAHVVDGSAQGRAFAPADLEVVWNNDTDPNSLRSPAQAIYLHTGHAVGGFVSPSTPNDMDVALVRLELPFSSAPVKRIGSHTSTALLGSILACSGFGFTAETNGNPSGPSGTLTFAFLTPTAQQTQFVTAPQNFIGQVPLEGDSGAGCVLPVDTSVIAGLISGGDSSVLNRPATQAYIIPAGRFSSWAAGIMSSCSDNVPSTASFCDSTCRCSHGQGDCDTNLQCSAGTTCDTDVGEAFGMPTDYEVCVVTGCDTRTVGSDTYCDGTCPCGLGGGDCDSGSGCFGDLTCANDYGPAFGAKPVTDICVPVGCEDRAVGSATFCRPGCPCGYGGGDCDSDADCMPGLTCMLDVGPSYAMSADTDVCLPAACAGQVPATTSACSEACPCGHGGGDCNSTAECMPGLTCVQNNGSAFDMPAHYDVCVR